MPGYSPVSSIDEIPYDRKKSPGRTALVAFGTALAMAFVILVLLAILIVYLFIIHHTLVSGTRLLTTAPGTRVVTITQVLSQVCGSMAAPVMALQAFNAAAAWMSSSAPGRSQDAVQQPTPLQLGYSMSVFGGANPLVLLSSLKFLCSVGKDVKEQRRYNVSAPRYLKSAVGLLLWLLFLGYGISGADTVLHGTATSRDIPSNFDYLAAGWSGDNLKLGRALNQTKCEDWNASHVNSSDYVRRSCGQNNGSNNNAYISLPESSRIFTNTSSHNRVALLDDTTAIVVPESLPPFSYSATSLGIHSSCKTITDECINCQTTTLDPSDVAEGDPLSYYHCAGSEAELQLDCTGTDVFQYNNTYDASSSLDDTSLPETGVVDPTTGAVISGINVTTNPFVFADVVTSFTYTYYANGTSVQYDQFYGDSGFITHGHQGAWNVLYCQVEVRDVLYRFTPPWTFEKLGDNLVDSDTAALFAQSATTDGNYPIQVLGQADGAGATDVGLSYANSYGVALSRYILAMSPGILMPTDDSQILLGATQLGSDLSLIALVVLVLLAVCYALTVLIVGGSSAISILSASSPALRPIRARLMSPLPLICQLHGRASRIPGALLSGNGIRLFEPELESDRLLINTVWNAESRYWAIAAHRQGM